jgi:hypothetical protein
LETAKKCVTTYLPNELALKMDGAQACDLYSAVEVDAKPQRVGVRGDCEAAHPVRGSVAVSSADLGGSSKYSSGNLEGRSGERFHGNSS